MNLLVHHLKGVSITSLNQEISIPLSNLGRASLFDQLGKDTMIQRYSDSGQDMLPRWESSCFLLTWHGLTPDMARLYCHYLHSVPDTSRVTSVILGQDQVTNIIIINVLSNEGSRQLSDQINRVKAMSQSDLCPSPGYHSPVTQSWHCIGIALWQSLRQSPRKFN